MTPRLFQSVAIEHGIKTLLAGGKVCYAAPTGVGKTLVELGVQAALPDCWIVSPSNDILEGFMEKLGVEGDPMDYCLCTPIRLRNRLLSGSVRHPQYLVFDENHHHNAETWQQLDLLTGLCPSIGYTATPYRGTPKSTKHFRERWGEPIWLIKLQEAAAEGYIALPTFEIIPLVDDDIVEVRGGEFDITSLESATVGRLGDLADHARRWYNTLWDRPTVFAMPSSESCRCFQAECAVRGLPTVTVSAATPRSERRAIYHAVEAGVLALLHINIVSEGVDLKLRRLVDVAPTMSPVRWVQQLGRIMRPWDRRPEYVGCNRNLLRHAYAAEGSVSTSEIVAAERAFPPTERAHSRALGLEAIGRFKGAAVKLLSGATLHVYSMSAATVEGVIVEYCCLVHPTQDPVWALKMNTSIGEEKQYGRWNRCETPESVKGFASVSGRELTEKQLNWWRRQAYRFGLDPNVEVNRKGFQALPVLCDTGMRFR